MPSNKTDSSFDKSAYDQSYRKSNVKIIQIPLNVKRDKDIIEHLNGKENKSGYIKELIRKDIYTDREE